VIHLTEEDIEKMIRHSQKESPEEACGILAGKAEDDGIWIKKVYECENVHPNASGEYFMKPEDQLRVFLEIEEQEDMDVVGFYHSHPNGPDSPSLIDSSKYYWPGYPMAIVSLPPEPSVTFWTYKEDGFHPCEVVRERF
jgi:proteasome lid subunit RPN8/RPN11